MHGAVRKVKEKRRDGFIPGLSNNAEQIETASKIILVYHQKYDKECVI